MKKLYKIYGYYQPQENKWYVGRTCRKQSTRAGKDGSQYVKGCPKFAEAIQKYGWSSFEYHVLETTEDEELSWELEKKWVALKDSFNNGYNSDTGGRTGKKFCDESLKRIKEKAIREGDSHGQKMREAWQNEETRNRMVQGMRDYYEDPSHHGSRKGQHFTEETKKKMQESSPTKRPVYLYTNLGQFVAMYPSQKEAERQTGIKQNTISAYLRNNPKKRYKNRYFVWSYEPPCTES